MPNRAGHLGIDTEASKETKDRYGFPYGDFKKVNRSALIHAKQRASQNDHGEIEKVAGDLLGRLRRREASRSWKLQIAIAGVPATAAAAAAEVRVVLPAHLKNLAKVNGEVLLSVPAQSPRDLTQRLVLDALEEVCSLEELRELQAGVREVYVDSTVSDYIVRLVNATRTHPDVYLGASSGWVRFCSSRMTISSSGCG